MQFYGRLRAGGTIARADGVHQRRVTRAVNPVREDAVALGEGATCLGYCPGHAVRARGRRLPQGSHQQGKWGGIGSEEVN